MSKFAVKTSGTGTGTTTLNVPETNVDRTLDLPLNSTQLVGNEGADFQTMPTVNGDPIVETGSNSDGFWTRWADGTQWCVQRQVGTFGTGSSSWSWTFPLSFLVGPQMFVQYFGGQTATVRAGLESLGENNTAGFVHNDSGSARNAQLCLAAHGRWK